MRAKSLRIRPREQRCRFQNVAVDQSERARVILVANGMEQQWAVDAVDRNPDVRWSKTANGELGAKIITGRDRWQHLRGPERIVGDQAAQCEQIAAAQHRLRGHAWLGFAKLAR